MVVESWCSWEKGGGVSPEPGKPREAVPRERILIAVTRCRRKVGRGHQEAELLYRSAIQRSCCWCSQGSD